MRKLLVDNFGPNSGGSSVSTDRLMRARYSLDNRTAFTIFASTNISSITDNGAGRQGPSFTSLFSDTFYRIGSSVRRGTDNNQANTSRALTGTTKTTGTINLVSLASNGPAIDCDDNSVQLWGVLA